MRNLNNRPSSLALAIAAAIGISGALPANALLITTTPVAFDNSASVTDHEGGASTSNTNASLGTSSISQFDASQGVLLGAALNLSSTRTQSTQVVSTAGSVTTGSNGLVTSSGTGSSSANLAAPGVNGAFTTINGSDSCTDHKRGSCTDSATTADTPTNDTLAVAAGSLDDYVGGGAVLVSRTAPTLTATQTSNVFNGTESTTYSVQWNGTVSATYDYLLHAAPSFDGASQFTLDLDFGTFYLGDPVSDLGFSIFNAGGDRVGLDLDSILGSGDTSILGTNLAQFLGLGAGSSTTFLASFDTSSLGIFSASYTLGLSDEDVGAGASRLSNYSVVLNLKGEVREEPIDLRPASVPEPGILSLLGIGLLCMLRGRRRIALTGVD